MITTVIHFDHGGSYVETDSGCEWDAKAASYPHAIPFKTSSLEDITYSVLVENIRRKIGLDGGTKIRMSYIPLAVEAKRQSYICDDEDVESYLYSMNVGQLRSFLHVEIDPFVDERGSSFGTNYGEMDSNARANNAITVYEEQHVEEEHVEEEHDGPMEIDGVRDGENVACDGEGGNDDGGNGIDECLASDEVDVERTHSQCVEEWGDGMTLEVGQEFERKEQAQNLVFIASHSRFYDFTVITSDTWRYVVKCREPECKWYLRVARPQGSTGTWKVITYRKMHSCSRVSASTTNPKRKGSASLVASVVQGQFPGVVDTPAAKFLMGVVQKEAGVVVSYSTALRGKKKAASVVRGNPEESYKILPSYLYMLEKTNIGTVTKLELDEHNRFKYLFIALGACVEGFKAMRKVLSVDATFLKTVYGGVLVFATAQDPNHHHYPIAFAVLDGENMASWNWFFTMLKTVVPDNPELVFLSDRNASLIKAISEVYPRANHGYCVFHLSQNVRTKAPNVHKEGIGETFRALADIYTVPEFEKAYGQFRSRHKKLAEYLDKSVDVRKWARCVFPGLRYNIGTTNSSESLNNVFNEARKYSLILMIDTIIEKLIEWFNNHREESVEGLGSRKLVPFVENELHESCEMAPHLRIYELNSFTLVYCVVGLDGSRYVVDLKNKSCVCKRFDLDKYPCVHAIAAVLAYMRKPNRTENLHLWQLCSRYYLLEQWTLAYYRTLYPVPDNSQWFGIPEDIVAKVVLPPVMPDRKGRLQETRHPSVGERRRKKTSNKAKPGLDLEACFNCSTSSV